MKTNGGLVKQLRLARSWSQEELATQARLSLRTIQRVESESVASLQTRKGIASAFEIDVSDLVLQEPSVIPESNDLAEAKKNGRLVYPATYGRYRTYVALRIISIIVLWASLAALAFVGFLFIFSGIFSWESTPYTLWQSAGSSILVTLVAIVPPFYLIRWLYRYAKKIELVKPTTPIEEMNSNNVS